MLRRFNSRIQIPSSASSSSIFSSSPVFFTPRYSSSSPSVQTVCPTAETSWKVLKTSKFFLTLSRTAFNLEKNEYEDDKNEMIQLPISWISHNSLNRRHITGQRTETLDQQIARAIPIKKKVIEISSAEVSKYICPRTKLERDAIQIKMSDGNSEWISFDHLSKYAARPPLVPLPKTSIKKEHPESNPRDPLRSPSMIVGAENIKRVPYSSLVNNENNNNNNSTNNSSMDKDKDNAMLSLYRDGLIIVEGCPEDTNAVLKLSDFLGAPAGAMSTLYGRNWIVESQPRTGPKNNIALSAEFLDLHNDLVYYQSMPGLQLLHCLTFDEKVEGGNSFFGDSFIAAERLRDENPVAFEVLRRVPCAFAKDDFDREIPASYYYACPLILCDTMSGAVNCVRWAPAFEVPMAVGGYMEQYEQHTENVSEQWGVKTVGDSAKKSAGATSLNNGTDIEVVNEFFDAYNEFAKMIRKVKEEQNLRFKMKPGECIVFNQTRMLHGREKFVEPEAGMRRLSGAYVNIDDFRSRCMARFALSSTPTAIRSPNWTFTNGGSR